MYIHVQVKGVIKRKFLLITAEKYNTTLRFGKVL